jgi:hypothetical protein
MEPIIRAGETYPLASDMSKADALDYWYGPEDEIFVVKEADEALGTYHLRPNCAGGGSHIANVGYMTSSTATGKGVGRRMVEHSLQQASKPFNSTSLSARTNAQSGSIRISASIPLGLFLSLYLHSKRGYVDVFVMFKTL